MEYLHVEVTSSQLSKRAGEPSGDVVRFERCPAWTTVACCDGLGSGVMANVAAQLHLSRLFEFERQGLSLRDSFARIVSIIQKARGERPTYAAVAVARVAHSGEATVLTYDMPPPIVTGTSDASLLPQRVFLADSARIGESHYLLAPGEGLILISDGISQSGMGHLFRHGWGAEEAARFVGNLVARKTPLDRVPSLLVDEARRNWGPKLGDDCSAVLASCRVGKQLSVFTGPPRHKSLDEEIAERFLASPGWKVVCGATTAKIVARHLGATLNVVQEESVVAPPRYEIEGIDLVTEGAITLTQVYNILEEDPSSYEEWSGVTELTQLLQQADRVEFLVGVASNPANASIAFRQRGILPRTRTVPLIRDRLVKAGKLVVVELV